MKWKENASPKFLYLDAEPAINVIVEINFTKTSADIRGYINDIMIYAPSTFKSISSAKLCAERWFKKQLKASVSKIEKRLKELS